MRILRLVFVGSLGLTAVACGLDGNGLAGDDGSYGVGEGGVSFDGTIADDANGFADGAPAPDAENDDTGPTSDDAPDDVSTPGDDSGDDAGRDAADASERTDASDASEPTDASDASDAGHALDAGGAGDATLNDASDASDAAEPLDASDASDAADAADACGPVEICNNGIDDDCNALIDCADPECTPAWKCTAGAVPSGWTVVEYAETTQPACSTGYGPGFNAFEGPSGAPPACSCSCSVTTPGSCTQGTIAVTTNSFSLGCGGAPVDGPVDGGACLPAVQTYSPRAGAEMQVTPVGFTGGACTPALAQTVPPVTYAAQGTTCRESGDAGAGCANGGVCAPSAAGTSFGLCIEAPGAQACPAGFTSSHTVGSGVIDARGCSACTCGGAAGQCGNASLTLYTTSNCEDGGETVPADDTCTAFPGPTGGLFTPGPTYVAGTYAADVIDAACPASPVFPSDGGVTLKGVRTVCCP